jgi:hypothetical protein
VTEVRRQLREEELHVSALTVPSHEPVHGKAVPGSGLCRVTLLLERTPGGSRECEGVDPA